MTRDELLKNLCYYDLRNPDGIKDDTPYEDELVLCGEHAKEDCSCDNCFYGRTKLTEFTLSLIN